MTVEEILAALQAILDEAGAEPLTDDQVQRYEDLEGKLTRTQKSEEIQKRNKAYNSPVRASAVAVHVNGVEQKDDTLERAFEHYMRTGKENQDLVELRAQGSVNGSEGGYLVPDGFRDKLVDRMKAFGGIANVVETVTTSTGNPLPWVTVDDTANSGEIVAESGTFAGGADLVFGTASLGAYSYMAGGGSATPLRVPRELMDDSAFDVQALVSNKLGERIARIQAPHLVTGTGSGEPQGITDGLTGIEILADGNGVTYDDLINFIHSVDPAYRETGCRWAFNDTSLATIKKIKDSHGDPIWRPASADMGTETGGGTLLGYPVTIDQAFPNISVASNTVNWGVFGNLTEGYVVRRVREVEVLVNPYTRMANRQVEFTAWARMDAVQQNVNAYVALTGEQ